MMHVNFSLSDIIILYISKISSSFLNVLQKNYLSDAYDQVPFSKW